MGDEEVAVKTVNRLHVTPQLTERDALRVMHKVVVPSWFLKTWPFDNLANLPTIALELSQVFSGDACLDMLCSSSVGLQWVNTIGDTPHPL